MQTRTYGELFKGISALVGTGGQLVTGEQDQLRHFINRRFQQAFDSSAIWPRYLITSEKRNIISYVLSGATGNVSGANGNYKFIGLNDGDIGIAGTKVYEDSNPAAPINLIYKNSSNAWVVTFDAGFSINSDGTIDITSAGSTLFTEADSIKKDKLEDVETWTPSQTSEALLVAAKNLIPYAETNKTTIGDFHRIHRKRAFVNDSSIEYDFFVDFDGANILNITNTNDASAFVTYKQQFTPYTITSGYYDSSLEVPGEFFNFIVHAVYADFLRVEGKQEIAINEEQIALSYLASELEKVDIISNNNTVNKRFSTYVNRQSR
tara:strand:- start:713 stop:1675 length:963 start_codon:yes stop_codon:yes gene_type:complete